MRLTAKTILLAACVLFMAGYQAAKKPLTQPQLRELAKGHDLVAVFPDGHIETYNGRGLGPLITHLQKGDLKNAQMYDKVTGRASALLLAYGGAKSLHTGMLSQEAVPVLEKYHITYTYDKQVPYAKFEAKVTKLPFSDISGVVASVTTSDGSEKLALALSEKDKYSQLITNEFYKGVKQSE